MKRSRRSVAWDHCELKNDLVHCQHCEAIPEAGGDEEPALSDTDEGSANTGAAVRLAKLARSYLCITSFSAAGLTATRLRSPLTPEHVNMLIFLNTNPFRNNSSAPDVASFSFAPTPITCPLRLTPTSTNGILSLWQYSSTQLCHLRKRENQNQNQNLWFDGDNGTKTATLLPKDASPPHQTHVRNGSDHPLPVFLRGLPHRCPMTKRKDFKMH
ncbi:unnamed protein product [Pleuronectes platessa]|uniref:Uncharacterized protein n=1 Tax=Pleuronectes platessa TaxID=8262 RepID=A0A9N7YCT4_PLEPL|nr:unnamed protein product [Pleuronectes platessa]